MKQTIRSRRLRVDGDGGHTGTGPRNSGNSQRPTWKTQLRRLRTFRWADFREVLAASIGNWYAHNVPRLGASLAFYTLLSLAPLLVIVVAVAGAVFGREAAEGQLVWQIQDLIGRESAQTIQALLRGAQAPGAGTVASILGLLTLLYGATAVVAELRDALNTIWCVPKKEQTTLRSILGVLRDRTVSLAVVLGAGFLLLVSLAVNAALSALEKQYQGWLSSPAVVLRGLDLAVSFLVITFLFALMYKLLPDLDLEWRDVIPGAMVTSILFSTGKTLIGIYLGTATVASAYGAAGSLVVLLFWVYYSAQIFFLGAEFTQVYAQTFGSKPCDRLQAQLKIDKPGELPVEPAPRGEEPLVKLS